MSKKSILIVDDDADIRQLMINVLIEEGFEIKEASNGKRAQEAILLSRPDYIISDVKMPEQNGIEFAHWMRINLENKIPFIMMTGFKDLLVVDEAISLGAINLLMKPFNKEELIKAISPFKQSETKQRKLDDDNLYMKVDLNTFVVGSTSPCSLFIKIRDGHYVKLSNKDEEIHQEEIEKYRNKNLEFMYVLKDEYKEYLGFNLNLLRAAKDNKQIPREKINNLISFSTGVALENAFKGELEKDIYDDMVNFAKSSFEILSSEKRMTSFLIDFEENAHEVYTHSICVASIAYVIAKKIGWHNNATLFKIYLAGLLHDIGLKELENLLKKDKMLLTDEEDVSFRTHPTRGMEILNKLGGVPSEVILSTYQHHEDELGQGYPLGIKKHDISPISKIIKVADIVKDPLLSNSGNSINEYRKAFKQVVKYKLHHYDQEMLEALREILKL
jgi:putative nucleotidyltransferase with HDIG domain